MLVGCKFIKFQIRRLDIFEGVHISTKAIFSIFFCFFQKDLLGKKNEKNHNFDTN